MKKRGKVLRDAASGAGLLMLEGQQYHFSPDGVWRSETRPRPGQVVEVELDSASKVRSITVVPDSQLALELADNVRTHNPRDPFWSHVGFPRLAAAGALAGSWLILTSASVQIPFPGKMEFTLWQILGILHEGRFPEMLDGRESLGPGLYGVGAMVALAGPFLYDFWKDRRALLGRLLPLVFVIATRIAFRNLAIAQTGKSSDTVSIGIGTYVSIAVCLYFVFVSARELFVPHTRDTPTTEAPERKAA